MGSLLLFILSLGLGIVIGGLGIWYFVVKKYILDSLPGEGSVLNKIEKYIRDEVVPYGKKEIKEFLEEDLKPKFKEIVDTELLPKAKELIQNDLKPKAEEILKEYVLPELEKNIKTVTKTVSEEVKSALIPLQKELSKTVANSVKEALSKK